MEEEAEAANASTADCIDARAAEPGGLLGAGEPENANAEKGLNIRAGKPMSMLSHTAWVLSFVEFFYGDCAPMQKRPTNMSLESLFQYLLEREELEYSLETDTQVYKARATSRWDTPEFVMIFASTLRSLNMLRASKFAIFGPSKDKQVREKALARFKQDLDAIAKAKSEDFERALAYDKHKGAQSLLGAFLSPQVRECNPNVYTALKHVLMQTATVALTEGNKMKVRHQGFALSTHHGSLKLFLTTNFADTYSPITLSLYQSCSSCGAEEPATQTYNGGELEDTLLGSARINLFEDAPDMPTLQTMHRIVARYPTIQAKLFLFMEKLVITELMCMDTAYIGKMSLKSLDPANSVFSQEDDFSSTCEPGLANFGVSLLEPLEAQGRGFTHGHKKSMGVPTCRASALADLFRDHSDEEAGELSSFMENLRDATLKAAETIQYDSATLCAEQLGEKVLEEPFSRKHQLQSRLDGGLEIDEITQRRLIDVTADEPAGHLRRERDLAEAELRTCRPSFKNVPLTGCHQSMLPLYRLPGCFGQIHSLDMFGLVNPKIKNPVCLNDAPWITTEKGEVTGYNLHTGFEATEEQRLEDARAWQQSYSRDVRALHVQNHTHDCSATCVKYAVKQSVSSSSNNAQAQPCRFQFFQVLRFMVENAAGQQIVKRILRKGKQIVDESYVASTNDRNEYGKVIFKRNHPFRSSTSDLLQAALRCNCDVQFQDRSPPDADRSDGGEQPAEYKTRLVYGLRNPNPTQKKFLHALRMGMKAAAICDFYMTKYQAKSQQLLSHALGPLLQGLRRLEAEHAEAENENESPEDKALSKLRRLMFAANKAHWYSQCELAICLLTGGGHTILTHADQVLFLSRPHYMMQECKRLLNGETLSRGPIFAADITQPQMFAVTSTFGAGEPRGVSDVDQLTDDKNRAVEPIYDSIGAEEPKGAEEPTDVADADQKTDKKPANLHIFESTTSNRDDWLHRGFDLQDLDWYHYVTHIERVRNPNNLSLRKDGCVFFAFDSHYSISKEFCQRLRHNPLVVPRLVGPKCVRDDVEAGEPNAMFKASLFMPLRCQGPDHCSDVLQCASTLCEPSRKFLTHRPFCANNMLCSCRNHPPHQVLFSTNNSKSTFRDAWKARRAQIECLATSGQRKTNSAKRIPVIHDCTTFKSCELQSRVGRHSARRNVALHHAVRQMIKNRAISTRTGNVQVHAGSVISLILNFLNIPEETHEDQLTLSEYVAVKTREVLLHIDMDVEARNTAIAKAKAHGEAQVVEDEGEVEKADTPVQLEFENVGGEPRDDLIDPHEADSTRGSAVSKLSNIGDVHKLLARHAEIDAVKRPGKHAEDHKQMLEVTKVFGTTLDNFVNDFQVSPTTFVSFHERVTHVLETQKRTSELIRRGLADEYEENGVPESHVFFNANPCVSLIDLATIRKGPQQVAWQLAKRAELNRDQLLPVALIAMKMQEAWEKLRGAEEPSDAKFSDCVEHQKPLLPLVGTLVRLLLVGGGGCGKTRIINMVLTPLLLCFYGKRGLLKQASSNKAARLIGGVTMHAANSLRGDSPLLTVYLRLNPDKQNIAQKRYGSLGAKLLDEFSQFNAKLWHADCYITSVARASIFELDSSRYSEPNQTWGCCPIVVTAGDELQMPPVPFETSLLAPIEETSHEQKVGVKIFSGFEYVYRLTTAMRFTDDVLINILRKMRKKGGCVLTPAEWKALEATEVKNCETDLEGTDLWYEASYVWSVVSMAQVVRSRLSAQAAKTTLYMVQAEDQLMNAFNLQDRDWTISFDEFSASVSRAILSHVNMNDTGRLPGIWLGHIGMRVRLTMTVEQGVAVTDSTGTIVGLDFDERELQSHQQAIATGETSVVLLKYLPRCVYVKLDKDPAGDGGTVDLIPSIPCTDHEASGAQENCPECRCFPDVVAIPPIQNPTPWSIEVNLEHCVDKVKLKIKRRQIPTTILNASTLHVLQGTTCDPGLIYHWTFPKRLRKDVMWLAVYVALSRVRSLKYLRSIGMTDKIKNIIEEGPPDSLPAQFEKYFGKTETKTAAIAEEAMQKMGWDVPAS